jgi:hypothetical protein
MSWAEREKCHWSFREGFTVPRQETERVLVPMEHEERRSQHDRAIPCECTHFPHGLNIYRKPTFAQRRRDCLGNFLR